MNFFGIHFCQDELFAILMALPFLGGITAWVKAKLHRHHKGCHDPKDNQS